MVQSTDPTAVSIMNVAVTRLVVYALNSNRDTAALVGCMQVCCLNRCVLLVQVLLFLVGEIAPSDRSDSSRGNHPRCFDTTFYCEIAQLAEVLERYVNLQTQHFPDNRGASGDEWMCVDAVWVRCRHAQSRGIFPPTDEFCWSDKNQASLVLWGFPH